MRCRFFTPGAPPAVFAVSGAKVCCSFTRRGPQGAAITGRSMPYLENCRKPVLAVVKSQAQAASCETFPRHGATRIANIPICARTAIDQNNPVYFFDFAQSPNIVRVNLLRFDFSPAPGACGISPEGEEGIDGNSNAAFRPAKPVTFLGPPLG